MTRELYYFERQLIEGMTPEEQRVIIAIVNRISAICGTPPFGTDGWSEEDKKRYGRK